MKNKILLLMILGLSIHTTSAITESFNPMKYRIVKAACKRFRVWYFPAYYQKKDIEKYYVFLQNLRNETSNNNIVRRRFFNPGGDVEAEHAKFDRKAESRATMDGATIILQPWHIDLVTSIYKNRANALRESIMEQPSYSMFRTNQIIDNITSREIVSLGRDIGIEQDPQETHQSIKDEWPDLFALASFYHRSSFASNLRSAHDKKIEEVARNRGYA